MECMVENERANEFHTLHPGTPCKLWLCKACSYGDNTGRDMQRC